MRLTNLLPASASVIVLGVSAAAASTIVLDFEGINSEYPSSSYAFIQDYYNDGTSSDGTSGTDFGVAFSPNAQAICLNTPGNVCSNTSRGGQGNPDSQLGGLFFLTGAATFMNVAAGFSDGFSFFYTAPTQSGSVSVFDGLDGTGNQLATLALPTTPSQCTGVAADFCPFFPIGVSFSGTAQSVSFAGVANQIVFDDVTFGSSTPGNTTVIPLPAGLPLLLGALGMLGLLRRRKG